MALTTNLVSYWRMEGSSKDSLGANNGTDTNIAYSAIYGKLFQGMSPTGTLTGTGIDVGNAAALRTTGDFTVSLWFNLQVNAQAGLFESGGQVASPYQNFTIWYNSGQGILFRVRDNAGGLPVNIVYTFSSTATWTHVVATMSGTTATLYINGTAQPTGTFTGTRNSLTNNCNIGGGISDTSERIIQGYIDEVGFWSRALSSSEVTQLYNSGNGLSYPFNAGNSFFML